MVIIHKIEGFLLGDTVHVGDFVPELDPIKLVGVFQQLRPEQNQNE